MGRKHIIIVALSFLGAVPPLGLEWVRVQAEARTDPPGTDGAGMAMAGVFEQGILVVIMAIIMTGVMITNRRRK